MLPSFPQAELINNLKSLIEASRSQIAKSVNQEMTLLYWKIGKMIHEDILKSERAGYGKQILSTVSKELNSFYGQGFSAPNISRMITLYQEFSDIEIISKLSAKLTWSHFIEILPIQDTLKRNFYAEMCTLDSWSVRTLREKMGKLLYERTVLSQEPHNVIKDSLALVNNKDKLNPKVILQNPYILDFLNLPSTYNESTLEQAILDEIQKFLLELGAGFCFVERQKRIIVGDNDYYVDLLLYNRYLRRMVAIELKTTKFKPAHKGQMEFYLKWLNKNEKRGDDLPPLGIILCAEKDQQAVEIFDLTDSGIHVAEYWTELPPKSILEQKIHDVMERKSDLLTTDGKYWDLDEEDES